MRYPRHALRALVVAALLTAAHSAPAAPTGGNPHPVDNPASPVMLRGAWFQDPHRIDFSNLPHIPSEHVVVSDVLGEGGHRVNQHCYLAHHDGKFWIMWSDGPGGSKGPGKTPQHDKTGQGVAFATSTDGLHWSTPGTLVEPRNGFVWVARGFWEREGGLLALAAVGEGALFRPGLELRAFRQDNGSGPWKDAGLVCSDALNNFPPKKISTGEWMMSRRRHDYQTSGIEFLVGGTRGIDQWASFPVAGSAQELASEEPFWWELPDGNLMALFRDNRKSGFLYRSFSTDNGRTWTLPVRTDFPDACSKFHGLRLADGRYVLVSNPDPKSRNPLALSISDDGMVFTRMGYLVGSNPAEGGLKRIGGVDYPHVLEHDGFLYIAFSNLKQTAEVLRVKISDLDALTNR